MRIGLSLSSTHLVSDPAQGAAAMIERAAAGAAAGLDFLTVGDRHATGAPYFQNTPMMGRLVAEWPANPEQQIGCLFLLPLWNPVLVAEHVATLASLHPGRFIVQTGAGGGEGQFAAMGRRLNRRGRDVEESIRVIRGLLAGETVTSERFDLRDAQVSPTTTQAPEWWLGGHSDAAIDRAARLGGSLYLGPTSQAAAADAIDRYRRACDEHGHTPERIVARIDLLVADTNAEADTVADAIVAAGYRGMSRADVVAGDVDLVASVIERYRPLGVTDVAIRQISAPRPVAVRSVELLGAVRDAVN